MRAVVVLAAVLSAAPPLLAQTLQPGWIIATNTGCRVWNSYPEPGENVGWTGPCQNNLAHGHGRVQWFKDNKPNGRFEGEYRDGKKNGRGVEIFPGGNRYDGEFRDNKRDGRGVFTRANGDTYDGEWRNGRPNGSGTYIWDGRTYSGLWTNGCFRQGDRWAVLGATAKECGFE